MAASTTTEVQAHELMAKKFLVVAPEDTLGEVAEKLAAIDGGSALVCEFGHLTGILTSRDILRAIAERVHPSEGRVREWMTADPVTAAPDTPAEDAARLMLAGGFHHLPITQDERPVGLLGLRLAIGALRPAWPGF